MFDKPEFPDFYGFVSHFPNLFEFPTDFQRKSLADSSDLEPTLKQCPNPVKQKYEFIGIVFPFNLLLKMTPASLPDST